jgi:hypothetical protein
MINLFFYYLMIHKLYGLDLSFYATMKEGLNERKVEKREGEMDKIN